MIRKTIKPQSVTRTQDVSENENINPELRNVKIIMLKRILNELYTKSK